MTDAKRNGYHTKSIHNVRSTLNKTGLCGGEAVALKTLAFPYFLCSFRHFFFALAIYGLTSGRGCATIKAEIIALQERKRQWN